MIKLTYLLLALSNAASSNSSVNCNLPNSFIACNADSECFADDPVSRQMDPNDGESGDFVYYDEDSTLTDNTTSTYEVS